MAVAPYIEAQYWKDHINGMIINDLKDGIFGNVLFIGCNHGAEVEVAWELCENATSLNGLDIDNDALSFAYRRKVGNFFAHDIRQKLPDEPKYDTIISFHTLEHFDDEELKTVVDNIYAALNKGGLVIVSVPYLHAYPTTEHKQFFDHKSLRKAFNKFDVTHCQRDDRVDKHGNKHDVITLMARKNFNENRISSNSNNPVSA